MDQTLEDVSRGQAPRTPKRTGLYQDEDCPCTNCKKYVPVSFGGLCVACADLNDTNLLESDATL